MLSRFSNDKKGMAEGGQNNLIKAVNDIKEQSGNHGLEYTCEEVEIRQLVPGDHLAVKHHQLFASYYHHGIYLSQEEGVVDFGGEKFSKMEIHKVDLARFMKNATLLRVNYPTGTCLDPKMTVSMAKEVIDQPELWGPYNLMRNNCEHFAIKCKTGLSDVSPQVLKHIDKCLKNPIKRLVLRKSGFILKKFTIK